jgi:twitching motility protein PilU
VGYVHKHKKSIINQRKSVDTRSFHAALKNTCASAGRDPDWRDSWTARPWFLAFADAGYLAISTLHANNANRALDRIINFFPHRRPQKLLIDLSNNSRRCLATVGETIDGKRRAAVEVLLVRRPFAI